MVATKLKVRIYGDPCLRTVCEPVEKIGPSERMLIESLIMTMHEEKGVGLAAPQVGITKRLFVVDIGDGPEALVNPKITVKKSAEEGYWEEGCLSIPGITVEVARPLKITVEYLNFNGKKIKRNCDGLLARVIQHENDHINGKLIIDYADPKMSKEIENHLSALKKSAVKKGAM